MSTSTATTTKKQRRSSHRTQWAAQFAVASELCKRGYEVALTMGNHPDKDMMVVSPKGVPFSIDVKGLYKENYWTVHPREARPNLYYVLAFVPDNSASEFFILTQDEANQGCYADLERAKKAKEGKGLVLDVGKGYFHGIAWKFAAAYKDRWDTLPQ